MVGSSEHLCPSNTRLINMFARIWSGAVEKGQMTKSTIFYISIYAAVSQSGSIIITFFTSDVFRSTVDCSWYVIGHYCEMIVSIESHCTGLVFQTIRWFVLCECR